MDPEGPSVATPGHPSDALEIFVSAALREPRSPRYGSAAELAAYSGLSVKTIRRLVESGKVRGLKVGRRLLVPFEDLDRHILGLVSRPTSGRQPVMATSHTPAATTEGPYVPPISAEELARRNRAALELLDSWETEGDEEEQRETLAVLRESLGARRVASYRNLFP
jgi:excisionase family DNA binding protein